MTIYVRGYQGLGDNFYQLPFVVELARRGHILYWQTPWHGLFAGMKNINLVSVSTTLRTQLEHQMKNEKAILKAPSEYEHKIVFDYNSGVKSSTSVYESFVANTGVRPEFKFPPRPEWVASGHALKARVGLGGAKKLALVKLPTVRKEWSCPARNPKMRYYEPCIDRLKKAGYTTVSVGYVETDKEWFDGPVPFGIDRQLDKAGMMSTEEFVGLCAVADVTLGYPSNVLPIGMVFQKPTFTIYGGHIKPELLEGGALAHKLTRHIAPKPFCHCVQNTHACNKEIPIQTIITEFERFLEDVEAAK